MRQSANADLDSREPPEESPENDLQVRAGARVVAQRLLVLPELRHVAKLVGRVVRACHARQSSFTLLPRGTFWRSHTTGVVAPALARRGGQRRGMRSVLARVAHRAGRLGWRPDSTFNAIRSRSTAVSG